MLKFIDLFAGTGAFTQVLEETGRFKCVFSNDMEASSEKIYKLNHNSLFLLENLNKVKVEDIPKHDLLCGGFPCQPFSIAGEQKGFEDERSNVFWKIIEILKYHTPDIVILENVKNLCSHNKGHTFNIIKTNLEKLGYFVKYNIIDTCQVSNIPHHRERIYIACFRKKEKYDAFDFNFKKVKNKKINSFLERDVLDKYYYTDRFKVYDEIQKNIVRHVDDDVLYQYRRYYVRENKSKCCPTLTANMGGGGHNVPLLKDNKGIRKLTPRECFNLQGFPVNYKLPKVSDGALYKLAGNAVSIPVIKLIINKIIKMKVKKIVEV
jgi:DNA (cytosine-5)-methyltransferase 1